MGHPWCNMQPARNLAPPLKNARGHPLRWRSQVLAFILYSSFAQRFARAIMSPPPPRRRTEQLPLDQAVYLLSLALLPYPKLGAVKFLSPVAMLWYRTFLRLFRLS